MKKLYTLTIAALATSAAFAFNALPPKMLNSNSVALDVEPIYGVEYTPEATPIVMAKETRVLACKKEAAQETKYNQAPPSVAAWSSMGYAILTEDALTYLYGIENMTIDVEVEENIMTDGLYRLVDPYKQIAEAVGGYYDDSTPHYLILHAENPDRVWFEQFNTGMTLNSEDGECILSGAAYWKSKGETDDNIASAGWFGKNIGGVITFGVDKLLASASNLDGMYYANRQGNFKIQLPGAKDYSINVKGTVCAKDNLFAFQVTAGTDVAQVGYYLLQGQYGFNDDNYNYLVDNGLYELLQETNTALGFNLANSQVPEGRYTLFVVALDEAGKFLNGEGTYFYKVVDDDENWIDFGYTMYGEDLIGSIYKIGPTEHKVKIQKRNGVDGYYRLVNAYQDYFAGAENNKNHKIDHNHYVYIDITEPAEAMILESPIGADWGYGDMSINSVANYLYDVEGADLTEYFGTLTDKEGDANIQILTFPEKALLFAESTEDHGTWYFGNQNSKFYLEIPREPLGVENIVADAEGKAEYFNLQGVRVEQPAAGSLVIRRQGGNASKIVVR